MIIGHELAHHALGHVSIWKNLLLLPAKTIPLLGAAYNRACELSADRVGMALAGDGEASRRALLALTVGSETLTARLDPQAFIAQEMYVPPIMGLIYELYASHPRMTVRIIELKKYEEKNYLSPAPSVTALPEAESAAVSDKADQAIGDFTGKTAAEEVPYCSSCGQQVLPGDRFCINCGQKL